MPVVMPNNVTSTPFRLPQEPKLSRSGDFAVPPASFILWKTGDSSSLRRMYTDTASRRIDVRNGIRQPHDLKGSSPKVIRKVRITTRESSNPIVDVVCNQLV